MSLEEKDVEKQNTEGLLVKQVSKLLTNAQVPDDDHRGILEAVRLAMQKMAGREKDSQEQTQEEVEQNVQNVQNVNGQVQDQDDKTAFEALTAKVESLTKELETAVKQLAKMSEKPNLLQRMTQPFKDHFANQLGKREEKLNESVKKLHETREKLYGKDRLHLMDLEANKKTVEKTPDQKIADQNKENVAELTSPDQSKNKSKENALVKDVLKNAEKTPQGGKAKEKEVVHERGR